MNAQDNAATERAELAQPTNAAWATPLAVGGVGLAVGIVAYLRPLYETYQVWGRSPDYSHGYLVPLIALGLLWVRKDLLDRREVSGSLWGLPVLAVAVLLRVAGGVFYLDPIEQLSLLVWLAALALLVGGGRFLRWSLPAIIFLGFMFPLPFMIEGKFSGPMQSFATTCSTWLLQTGGLPAFATGNVIHIGDYRIEVVQACSGLRMLMGFLALCTAYAIVCSRGPIERVLIVIGSVPIAITCNILRITTTGFLYQYASSNWAHKFTHDLAGWFMMPTALVILWVTLWYFDHLFVETEVEESVLLASRPAG